MAKVRPSNLSMVPLRVLIVLPQMRRSMLRDQLDELMQSIVAEGQINPILVARYTSREKMLAHLTMIRDRVYQEVPEPLPGKDGTFFIVVAGHRRLAAHSQLWENGCADCQAMGRAGGSCWLSHRSSLSLNRARQPVIQACVFVDPDPEEMIRKQLAENIHVQPDAMDAALAYAAQFHREAQLARAVGQPAPSLTAFARRHGRSPSTIKSAIAFASLPHAIRALAANGAMDGQGKRRLILPYEGAVALAQLLTIRSPLSEEELMHWCRYGLAKGLRVPQWQELVACIIEQREQQTFAFAPPVDTAAVERAYVARSHLSAMRLLGQATEAVRRTVATGNELKLISATRRVRGRLALVAFPEAEPPEEAGIALRGVARALHEAEQLLPEAAHGTSRPVSH